METFAGGALSEKFNIALVQCITNMLDENTSFKPARNIAINISFKQDESRSKVEVAIECKAKLAPPIAAKTSFSIGKDLRTGQIEAQEYGAPALPNNMRVVGG